MIHDWIPYLRAGLFAGIIVFVNYDMWAALKETGVSFVGADSISDLSTTGVKAAQGAAAWLYLAEILALVVFCIFAALHFFIQKFGEGQRKIWYAELFFVVAALIFAHFTAGFAELAKLFSFAA